MYSSKNCAVVILNYIRRLVTEFIEILQYTAFLLLNTYVSQ